MQELVATLCLFTCPASTRQAALGQGQISAISLAHRSWRLSSENLRCKLCEVSWSQTHTVLVWRSTYLGQSCSAKHSIFWKTSAWIAPSMLGEGFHAALCFSFHIEIFKRRQRPHYKFTKFALLKVSNGPGAYAHVSTHLSDRLHVCNFKLSSNLPHVYLFHLIYKDTEKKMKDVPYYLG